MSRELLQPSVLSASPVNIEFPTEIKNEPPESEIVEIGIDDILDSSESEEEIIPYVKGMDIVCEESIKSEILESYHCESMETQVLLKAENSPFIQADNKTEDTNFSKDLNGSTRTRKTKQHEKTNFVETTSWEKDKEKINVIKTPVIPVEAHEYTSLAKDKHVCNHCQYASNRLYTVKCHIKRMHREVTTMYQCPYCPYESKWSVRSHIIQKHKDTKDIEWFQCNLCEMKFKLKGNLTKHMDIHLKHKQNEDGLDLCEKRVGPHEYITLTKFRHACNHCRKTSKTVSGIKLHIKRIHREVTTTRRHIIPKHKDTEDIQCFRFHCNNTNTRQHLKFNVQRLQNVHTLSSQAAAASSPASSAVDAGVLMDAHPLAAHHHHPLYLQGSAHSSGGSVSSTGVGSPTSPLGPGKEEECSLHGRSSTEDRQPGGVEDDDDSQDAGSSRAQHVSTNCVVFTHYPGDAASVVDEHFNRALER